MIKTKNRFFYGWIIVGIAMLSLIVSNGLSIGGIPVFYKSVQAELINSRTVAPEKIQTVFGIAPALTFLLAGFLSPVAAFLLQKFNVRLMMLIGCVILGSGLVIYSQASSPIIVYLAHSLMGTSLGFVGVLVSTVLISNWFQKKRGTALGIVLTGTSFGGVLIPQIATPLIQNYGWRAAMIFTSLIIWLVLLPAIIFLVKNNPSDLELLPDGESSTANGQSTIALQQSQNGMSLKTALGTPVFWIFSLCAALVFYAFYVVSQQLNLYLQSPKAGFTSAQASGVQSLLFGLSILGKFLFGWLSDVFPASRVMLVSATIMFLATLALLHFNGQNVYLFAVFFGLNYGGTFVLLQLLIAEYFGLKEYGKILGAVTVIETVGGALGTVITGKIADSYGGDYTQAFYGVIIVAAFALLMVVFLNLFKNKFRKPIWFLPLILMPVVGAAIGAIAGPVFTELYKVIAGTEISLVIPVIIIFLITGLMLGFLAGNKLRHNLIIEKQFNEREII